MSMSTKITELFRRTIPVAQPAIRVLLVEDTPADRIRFRDATRRLFSVEDAYDLATARARIEQGGLDVVVADLGLPDARGVASVQGLRRAGAWLPIVVWTASPDVSTAVECIRAGAAAVAIKGRDDDALAWHIQVAIGRDHAAPKSQASEMLSDIAAQLRAATG